MVKRHDWAHGHATATVPKHHSKAKPPVLQLITDRGGILARVRQTVHGVGLATRDGEIGGLPFGKMRLDFLQSHKAHPKKGARRG